jgi:hypothetical protein
LLVPRCPHSNCHQAHHHGGGTGENPILGCKAAPCGGPGYELKLIHHDEIPTISATARWSENIWCIRLRRCPFCEKSHVHYVGENRFIKPAVFCAVSTCEQAERRWIYRIELGEGAAKS